MRIDECEYTDRGQGHFGAKRGWFARVNDEGARSGRTLNLSRLDGETEWTMDALFLSNGYPVFVHGFGSRVTIPQVLMDPDTVAALDARARGRRA